MGPGLLDSQRKGEERQTLFCLQKLRRVFFPRRRTPKRNPRLQMSAQVYRNRKDTRGLRTGRTNVTNQPTSSWELCGSLVMKLGVASLQGPRTQEAMEENKACSKDRHEAQLLQLSCLNPMSKMKKSRIGFPFPFTHQARLMTGWVFPPVGVSWAGIHSLEASEACEPSTRDTCSLYPFVGDTLLISSSNEAVLSSLPNAIQENPKSSGS